MENQYCGPVNINHYSLPSEAYLFTNIRGQSLILWIIVQYLFLLQHYVYLRPLINEFSLGGQQVKFYRKLKANSAMNRCWFISHDLFHNNNFGVYQKYIFIYELVEVGCLSNISQQVSPLVQNEPNSLSLLVFSRDFKWWFASRFLSRVNQKFLRGKMFTLCKTPRGIWTGDPRQDFSPGSTGILSSRRL